MSKIAKRTKKETKVETPVVEKAPIEAKKATPKTSVKELQLELNTKDQQISEMLDAIDVLDKMVNKQQGEKDAMMRYSKGLEAKISALMGRGLIARILNTDV